jgi:RNA polymerase sigma-70 factor (ECF subfamily)
MPFRTEHGAIGQREPPVDLVGRIAAGDRAAEREFVALYARGVRLLVRRRCRPGDPAVDDLTQDIVSRVLERLRAGALRDAVALPAYLQQAVVFATSTEYRRRMNTAPIADAETLPAHEAPDRAVATMQLAAIVAQLLTEMTVARDRDVLRLFYLEECDKHDVCRTLGIEETHFRRVVFRARERFRELLERRGIGGEQ